MEKLLVIDGNSILNRAFYGVRPLTNSAGLHTNALFGMLNILWKQLSELSPQYAAIAFDLPAPTFRHKEYAEYKAGRKRMPDELAEQLPYSKRLSAALGLKVLELEGYEADDILGTVSRMAQENNVMSYVLTGDRDSLQLIGDKTSVLLATNTDTVLFDRDRFFEKYGVEPESFVDVKALMGDSSDNIPGVPGIGEKTALKLIAEFGNIDRVYENLENAGLGKSAFQKMTDGRELAYLSKRLATIERAAPLGLELEALRTNGPERSGLLRLLSELEFTSVIKRLGLEIVSGNASAGENDSKNGHSPDFGDENECAENKIRVKDISFSDIASLPAGRYGFAYTEGSVFLSDGKDVCRIKYSDNHELNKLNELNALIASLNAQGSKLRLCVHDYKKLAHVLADASKAAGSKETVTPEYSDDVMLAAYVVNPSRSSYRPDELFSIYLGGEMGVSVGDFQSDPENAEAEKKAASEAVGVRRLWDIFEDKLSESGQAELYRNIEMPLASVLADMELCGFKLDVPALEEFLSKLKTTEQDYASRIYMLAGREFNINSPKQLGEVLFDELCLPSGKKTKTGYSTNAEVLEKLRGQHPIIREILEYREIAKLRSTYAEGLLRAADAGGRVHTTFSQTTAVTGRLSSIEPNLQNIPVRSELGREMRRFFISSDASHCLIDADYSQIELRLLAHIAHDPVMTEAFEKGEDIHTVTASQVFGVPAELVTPEMRKRAKAVNFGIVYGIGDFSLAGDIGVSRKEAGQYIESYFAKYTGISEYLHAAVEAAKQLGYVETIFGRRRYIPELTSPKAVLRKFGERVAMNSPIQGSSADIIKLAMINVSRALKAEGLDARLILQIHDELIVESALDCADRAAEILRREMESVASDILSVPLTVDLQTGKSWFECK